MTRVSEPPVDPPHTEPPSSCQRCVIEAQRRLLMDRSVQVKNRQGEWVPAIPLPYLLPFHISRCECGKGFLSKRRYREHYALVHILDLD